MRLNPSFCVIDKSTQKAMNAFLKAEGVYLRLLSPDGLDLLGVPLGD